MSQNISSKEHTSLNARGFELLHELIAGEWRAIPYR
jgi:hypothetical protein